MASLAQDTARNTGQAEATQPATSTATAVSKETKSLIASGAQEYGAPPPSADKADKWLSAPASPSVTTTSTRAASHSKSTAEQKHIDLALDVHKKPELRLRAYTALSDDQQTAVYQKLGADDKKIFPAPSTAAEKTILKEVRDRQNTDAFRGEELTKLSPIQQKIIAKDLGHSQTVKLLTAYEADLASKMKGAHSAEEKAGFETQKTALKAAKENIGADGDRHKPGALEKFGDSVLHNTKKAADRAVKSAEHGAKDAGHHAAKKYTILGY